MATIQTIWTRPVALVGLFLLVMAPGMASAMPCGPEEDTTIQSKWTGVYDTECYGECDSSPASSGWKIAMETVEETEGTWYKMTIERGEKSMVLAGVMSGSDIDPREWGIEKGRSPMSKLGGAAVMGWMAEKMETPGVEFAGWVQDERIPVERVPGGGKAEGGAAVPEPTAALLFAAGFALTSMRRRTTA